MMNFTLKYSKNKDFLGYFLFLNRKHADFATFNNKPSTTNLAGGDCAIALTYLSKRKGLLVKAKTMVSSY